MGADPFPEDCEHSIEHLAGLLEAQLDALHLERAHLVGNSLGGWLALELARRNRASSVVALAPGGGWELGGRAHRRLVRKFKLTHQLLQVAGPMASTLGSFELIRRIFLAMR